MHCEKLSVYIIILRSTGIKKLQRDTVKSSTDKPKWNAKTYFSNSIGGTEKRSEWENRGNEKEKHDIMVELNTKIQITIINLFLKYLFIYLERGEGREKRRRDTLMWERIIDQLPLTPWPEPNLQPRNMPQPGVEPVIICSTGQCSSQLSHTSQGNNYIKFKLLEHTK